MKFDGKKQDAVCWGHTCFSLSGRLFSDSGICFSICTANSTEPAMGFLLVHVHFKNHAEPLGDGTDDERRFRNEWQRKNTVKNAHKWGT